MTQRQGWPSVLQPAKVECLESGDIRRPGTGTGDSVSGIAFCSPACQGRALGDIRRPGAGTGDSADCVVLELRLRT